VVLDNLVLSLLLLLVSLRAVLEDRTALLGAGIFSPFLKVKRKAGDLLFEKARIYKSKKSNFVIIIIIIIVARWPLGSVGFRMSSTDSTEKATKMKKFCLDRGIQSIYKIILELA
jgi:hypothetical protein